MYVIDVNAEQPLYRQLSDQIKKQIMEDQELYKLPSIRKLAATVNVSKTTVESALDQLVAEGWAEVQPNRGYFAIHKKIEPLDSLVEEKISKQATLFYGAPHLSTASSAEWHKAIDQAIQDDPMNIDNDYSEKYQGSKRLRQLIAKRINQTRGLTVRANQIMITSGASHSLSVVVELLDHYFENWTVAMENPGYRAAFELFKRKNVNVDLVEVDSQGMNLTQLESSPAKLAYVTPSHQFPLGSIMPREKRKSLVDLISARDGFIIEDDYDCEFTYTEHPQPAVASIARDQTIYLGSFSKSIDPGLRVSYMVLPSKLLPLYDNLFQFETCPVAWIIQCALIRFIENHQYERLVYKNLRANRKKYLAILQLFSDKFVQDVASLPYKTAGLHMVFELKDPAQATIFREKLSQKSLTLTSFDQYELNGITRNAVFIIGYAQYTTSELTDALNRLEKIFKELSALKSMKLSL